MLLESLVPFLFVSKLIMERLTEWISFQFYANQIQYCKVEQPVGLQEIHISKTGGSHSSPCSVELFCGGSDGEQHIKFKF